MVMARYQSNKSLLAKDLATIIFPVILCLIPCGDVYTLQMKLFLASTVMAILCFAFENVPQLAVALLLPVFWIFFGIAPASTVFTPWTNYIPWAMLAGLALATVLESTGLLRRVSYWIIAKVGSTYNRILLAVAFIGLGGTFLVGDVCIPLATLCIGLCRALDLDKCKEAAGIMLVGAMSALMGYMIMFNAPLMQMGIAADLLDESTELYGYFESFWKNLPRFLEVAICIGIAMLIFRPSKPINGKQFFSEKLAEMGKMTVREKKTAVLVIFYFIFLATRAFGGRTSLEWGMVLFPLLSVAPIIGAATKEDIQTIPLGFVAFVNACMGIGTVAVSLGIGQLIVNIILPILDGASSYTFFLIEWFTIVLGNFVMTPIAMYAAFTVPFTVLAQAIGIDPMAVYYLMKGAGDQIIFPYEYALYLIYFAFGVVRMKDFMKMMGIKMAVDFIVTFALLIPWWRFVGVLAV